MVYVSPRLLRGFFVLRLAQTRVLGLTLSSSPALSSFMASLQSQMNEMAEIAADVSVLMMFVLYTIKNDCECTRSRRQIRTFIFVLQLVLK